MNLSGLLAAQRADGAADRRCGGVADHRWDCTAVASVRVSTGREAIEDDRCPLLPSSNDGPRAGDNMALNKLDGSDIQRDRIMSPEPCHRCCRCAAAGAITTAAAAATLTTPAPRPPPARLSAVCGTRTYASGYEAPSRGCAEARRPNTGGNGS